MPAVASDPNALSSAVSARSGRPQRSQPPASGERDADSPFALMLDAAAPAPNRAPRKNALSEPPAPSRRADADATAEQVSARKTHRKTDHKTAEGVGKDSPAGTPAASDKGDLPETANTDAGTTPDDAVAAAAPPPVGQPEPIAAPALPVAAAADTAPEADSEAAPTVGTPDLSLAAKAAPTQGADGKLQTGREPEVKAADASAAQTADVNTDMNPGSKSDSKPGLKPDLPLSVDDTSPAKADTSTRMAGDHDTARAEPADTTSQSEPQKAEPAQKPAATHAGTTLPDPTNPPPSQHHTMLVNAPQDAAHPRAMTAAMTTQTAVPVSGLAVEIAAQAKAGNSRFEIRLDPQELGRIDVRLDVDKDGNVKSRLIIERADTYDLLRRDASTLERALQQAGLKTSDHGLEFTLRDQGSMQRDAREHSPRNAQQTIIPDADILPEQAASGYSRLLGTGSGIDIRI